MKQIPPSPQVPPPPPPLTTPPLPPPPPLHPGARRRRCLLVPVALGRRRRRRRLVVLLVFRLHRHQFADALADLVVPVAVVAAELAGGDGARQRRIGAGRVQPLAGHAVRRPVVDEHVPRAVVPGAARQRRRRRPARHAAAFRRRARRRMVVVMRRRRRRPAVDVLTRRQQHLVSLRHQRAAVVDVRLALQRLEEALERRPLCGRVPPAALHHGEDVGRAAGRLVEPAAFANEHHRLLVGQRVERPRTAAEDLPEDDPQRPHVATAAVHRLDEHLWRRPLHRDALGARRLVIVVRDELRPTEVGQFDAHVVGDEVVARAEVAMQHVATRLEVDARRRHLHAHVEQDVDVVGRERLPAQTVAQDAARIVARDDEERSRRAADADEAHHLGGGHRRDVSDI